MVLLAQLIHKFENLANYNVFFLFMGTTLVNNTISLQFDIFYRKFGIHKT